MHEILLPEMINSIAIYIRQIYIKDMLYAMTGIYPICIKILRVKYKPKAFATCRIILRSFEVLPLGGFFSEPNMAWDNLNFR